MSHTISKWVLAVVLLLVCGSVSADCRDWAMEGDWTVFYRDNGFPTSVLAPDETIDIQLDRKSGEFSIEFTDPKWKSWVGSWQTACIKGQTILLGAIQRRGGRTTLIVEISRVFKAEDLLRNSSGVVKERQINIRFPQPFAATELSEELAELAESGKLASHPGHAHGTD